ncbi:hypothetical protein GCM10011519_28440 [Marmoricola endophyticus]|uniref:DUF559 domain-containing protein n=1 Tax=Marmoricola endophyticus TaxID=2040280 RepID=A0A917BQM4_9ACTN|nr:hypothetical protein [Marmoricola endophyticus]GGF52770.1 hypothetical protein GCM10011519_28440 [Marmoricola endophyticus]
METRLRLVWRLVAGLPPLSVNAPVFDLDGRHLGTPDLLDVEAGLAVEHDGAEHHGGTRRLVDSRREDGLREAGLSYLTVLGAELHDHARLAERLRRARTRAMAARPSPCWTAEPPAGWVHLDSVASRRRSRPWPDRRGAGTSPYVSSAR